MKYIFFLCIVFLPTLLSAQTPSIYDDWTISYMGMEITYTITPQLFIVHSERYVEFNARIPGDHPDTAKIIGIVFDSLRSSGRIFVKEKNGAFAVVGFRIADEGIGEYSILQKDSLPYGYSGERSQFRTLESARKETTRSKNAEMRTPMYSSKRTAEFRLMKAPAMMPKAEVLIIIDTLWHYVDKYLKTQRDNQLKEEGLFPGDGEKIFANLLIQHGYNPLEMFNIFKSTAYDKEIDSAMQRIQDLIRIQEKLSQISRRKADSLFYKHRDSLKQERVKQREQALADTTKPYIVSPDLPIFGNNNPMPSQNDIPMPAQVEKEPEPDVNEFIKSEDPKPLRNIQKAVKYPDAARKVGKKERYNTQRLLIRTEE